MQNVNKDSKKLGISSQKRAVLSGISARRSVRPMSVCPRPNSPRMHRPLRLSMYGCARRCLSPLHKSALCQPAEEARTVLSFPVRLHAVCPMEPPFYGRKTKIWDSQKNRRNSMTAFVAARFGRQRQRQPQVSAHRSNRPTTETSWCQMTQDKTT